ncbi:hypothetical protein LTR62_006930 [Meristemomyces frigidus]|uniref:Phosphatidylinositol N-acetylglucosaminyltransferase n=1 Tax=Meristemomyces frigidus TaxID=1508187 RepID=A0AAN7TBM3_9PEZI|nr:hypothetical protein LTR62_006930 [Meristemomyces frigidus]
MSSPYTTHPTPHSSRNSSLQSEDSLSQTREHSRLRPEDAISGPSPPRHRPRQSSPLGRSDTVTPSTVPTNIRDARPKRRDRRRGRSNGRATKPTTAGVWKKLLWVKQDYPDNYTDEETFLDHLQWNSRLRPYEFWPLVADSTIIVQHVCSVMIFVCCFTGIFQARVGPETVVGWATVGTVAGWVFRDLWQSQDMSGDGEGDEQLMTDTASWPQAPSTVPDTSPTPGMGTGTTTPSSPSRIHSRAPSTASLATHPPPTNNDPCTHQTPSPLSPRTRDRLTTFKSALLIYFTLLGLSPLLRSLTKSTSSDSIWALSTWLLLLNVFTFDYGAGAHAKFPASLSTNAALMASTVLASRLPTTTHVFSLTLFSIEVFGLFPVFRRHLRFHSWTGHLWLTAFLVVMAGAGLSMTISGGGWGFGFLGVVLGAMVTGLSMGMTSWWLIGLQRYKNEIRGPWDPARPVIRRGWD